MINKFMRTQYAFIYKYKIGGKMTENSNCFQKQIRANLDLIGDIYKLVPIAENETIYPTATPFVEETCRNEKQARLLVVAATVCEKTNLDGSVESRNVYVSAQVVVTLNGEDIVKVDIDKNNFDYGFSDRRYKGSVNE